MALVLVSKDESIQSKRSLMATRAGRQLIKEGMLKSRGFKLFAKYKKEADANFPGFAQRFADDLLEEIKSDADPKSTLQDFADEVDSAEMLLEPSEIGPIKAKLKDPAVLKARVLQILDSNFVKMTFPVFNALYDGAAGLAGRNDPGLRQDIVEGHILAIDLSEPMDRIIDKDEDLEYLDDYKLMNPYILKLARRKIARGGEEVLAEFERGFKEARAGQHLDEQLKSRPAGITEEEMTESYKKYRAVMGTAGRNMALAQGPLGEIFYLGMARAAEGVGCGNEMEDSIRNRYVKIPSWPLYYSTLCNDVKKGFEMAIRKSDLYLKDARIAIDLLPDNFKYREFLEFLFLTVEHYNWHWYGQLYKAGIWSEFKDRLGRQD